MWAPAVVWVGMPLRSITPLFCAIFVCAAAAHAATVNVSSASALVSAVSSAQPGDEVVLLDGIYSDIGVRTLTASGSAAQPIIVRPQTPGRAIFRGDSAFILSGTHMVFRDFYFHRCQRPLGSPNVNVIRVGYSNGITPVQNIQVLNNLFYQCGNFDNYDRHIVRVAFPATDCRVADNTFDDSVSMAVGYATSTADAYTGHVVEQNVFKNVRLVTEWHPTAINGIESLQMRNDYSPTATNMAVTVRQNVFQNVVSDFAETISVKFSGAIITGNVFLDCASAVTLRFSNNSTISNNYWINRTGATDSIGLRVYGDNHRIINNYFYGIGSRAIALSPYDPVDNHPRCRDVLVAHNTFAYYRGQGIRISETGYDVSAAPLRPRILNNLFLSDSGVAISVLGAESPEYTGNRHVLTNTAIPGLSNPGLASVTASFRYVNEFWRPASAALANLATYDAPSAVSLDMDGEARPAAPQGGAVGADEGASTDTTPAPSDYQIALAQAGVSWAIPAVVIVETPVATTGENAATSGSFRITRTGSVEQPLTINYLLSGSAVPNTDFDASPFTGTLTFPAGIASVDLPVLALDDAIAEILETLMLTATTPPGYFDIGTGTATVTLTDDDRFSPASLAFSATSGGSASLNLSVTNPSSAACTYSVAIPAYSPVEDSTQSGGPAFAWIDGVTGATALTALDNKSDAVTSVALGLTFPYYGTNYTTAYVSTNGWISFTNPSGNSYPNFSGSDTAAPNNLVAPLWDNYMTDASSRIYYKKTDANTVVITYQNLRHAYSADWRFTAQIVLKASGEILFQYQSVSAEFYHNYYVRLENQDGSAKMAYSHSGSPNVTSGLAVRFRPVSSWLAFSPASISVPANSTANWTVQANATGLPLGSTLAYTATITPSDSAQSAISLPITLSVTDVATSTGLSAAAVSASRIDLAWTDAATNETGYRIERRLVTSSTWTEIAASLPANTTSYADTTVTAGSAYVYRVRASGTNATSAYSGEASATPPFATAPALAAAAINANRIDLVFGNAPAAATGLRIERRVAGGSFAFLTDLPVGTTTYSDTGLALNTGYEYRARAYNPYTTSPWSSTAAATTLGPFGIWQLENFSTEELADGRICGPLSDPDGDGIVNILEQAFATDPRSEGGNVGQPEADVPGSYLELAYVRHTDSPLTYTHEVSGDLVAWDGSPGATTIVATTDNNDGTVTVQVRDNTPASAKRFMRVRVGGWADYAATETVYPSTDLRLRDDNNDGIADNTTELDTGTALNVGDTPANATWRSVIEFPITDPAINTALRTASSVKLRIKVQSTNGLTVLKNTFDLQLAQLTGTVDGTIRMADFSAASTVLATQDLSALPASPNGTVIEFDVTSPAKAAAPTASHLGFRLQLDLLTNSNNTAEQANFHSGSGNINAAADRPQIIITQ